MVSRNCSWTTATPVFFERRQVSGLEGDLLADLHKLIGQLPEALVAFDSLADGFELIGRDAFAEVLAAEPTLQDVVRTPADGFAPLLGLEELLAEVPAAELIDGPHFLEDLLATLVETGEVVAHGVLLYSYYTTRREKKKKTSANLKLQKSATFLSCTRDDAV